jgi:SAM-dependent methyltransferase
MRSGPGDTAALFEDAASWESYEANPYIEQRSRIVRSMIPDGVHTIADIGCGNGLLLRSLSEDHAVVGVDPSRVALGAFDLPRACGRGEALPLRSASVDLVTCLEVLEHLADGALRVCADEIARVTRRWLLVATPDAEDPLRNALRCPRCGRIFNRSHHLQSFDARRLAALFPGFELREERRGGQPVRDYPRALLWARHRFARRFYKGPGETRGLCPVCGNRDFPPFRPNLLSVLLDGANRLLSRRRPYWVLLLLEKRSGGSIGGDR